MMLVWATAPPARGANDASGLAALLSCSEQVLALLPGDTELWVVASGAGKVGARGLRAFVAEHGDWPAETALFIDFETLGIYRDLALDGRLRLRVIGYLAARDGLQIGAAA